MAICAAEMKKLYDEKNKRLLEENRKNSEELLEVVIKQMQEKVNKGKLPKVELVVTNRDNGYICDIIAKANGCYAKARNDKKYDFHYLFFLLNNLCYKCLLEEKRWIRPLGERETVLHPVITISLPDSLPCD